MEYYVKKKERPTSVSTMLEKTMTDREASRIEPPKFKVINLYSNMYDISIGIKGQLFRWNLVLSKSIPKDRDPENYYQRIFRAYRLEIVEKIGYCFRSGTIFYAVNTPEKEAVEHSFSIEGMPAISLTYKGKSVSLDETSLLSTNKKPLLQALNSGLKFMMKKLDYTELKKSRTFFDLSNYHVLYALAKEYIVKVSPGYFISANIFNNSSLKLTIDPSNVLIRDYSLWDEYFYLVHDKKTHTKDEFIDEFVIGQTFLANYGSNISYKIDGVAQFKTPKSEFPESKYKNFIDYYKQRHEIDIKYPDQFLVFTIRENKIFTQDGEVKKEEEYIYLVPELLKPTGLIEKMREDNMFMKELTNLVKHTPVRRMSLQQKLMADLKKLVGIKNNHLLLSIKEESNRVQAIQLEKPEIHLAKRIEVGKGNFTVRQPVFDSNAALSDWAVLCEEESEYEVKEIIHKIKESSRTLCIKVEKPVVYAIRGEYRGNRGNFLSAKDIIHFCRKFADKKIVLICLKKKNINYVYREVKAECMVHLGLNSQFYALKYPKRSPSQMLSIASNLLVQMCTKNSYKIWKVMMPEIVLKNGHQIMVVGADVSHKNLYKSVISVVSSFDKDCTSYFSQTSIQSRKGDDIMNAMGWYIQNSLRRYMRENKAPPGLIVVFRDGVGNGQIEAVREKELQPLIDGIKQEYPNKNIMIAYIIVKKRLNVKFYDVASYRGEQEYCNPPSGTVVDNLCVGDSELEFFMVSQEVRDDQGTATPTCYEMIYNSTDLPKEIIYQIAYCQCFAYYNWSGPLKIPAVVMMANRLAKLVGSFTGKEGEEICIKDILRDKLSFI